MQKPSQVKRESIYDQIGGETGVEVLVNTFCDYLESTEQGKPVYLLHLRGHGMAHARMEQLNFFSSISTALIWAELNFSIRFTSSWFIL